MEKKANTAAGSSKEQEPWLLLPRDPGAPKRNRGAYILYYDSMIERFSRDNPAMGAEELLQHASESYGALSATEKGEWDAKAEADKARHMCEVATYVPPTGYDALGDLVVVEPTHKNGRKVTKSEIERTTVESCSDRGRSETRGGVFFPETV